MLMERIIGALTFNRQVYADVENDTSFTNTAWTIVAVVALVVQIPGFFVAESATAWIISALVGALVSVLAFALGAYVVAWVGKSMFQADVTFEEMVRTLGLAYVWTIIGVIPLIACVSWIAGLAAWFIAAREALDLETGQTIITVIVGWVVVFLVTAGIGFVLGLLGLSVAAATGALSG
jgi:hypothetical protein